MKNDVLRRSRQSPDDQRGERIGVMARSQKDRSAAPDCLEAIKRCLKRKETEVTMGFFALSGFMTA